MNFTNDFTTRPTPLGVNFILTWQITTTTIYWMWICYSMCIVLKNTKVAYLNFNVYFTSDLLAEESLLGGHFQIGFLKSQFV